MNGKLLHPATTNAKYDISDVVFKSGRFISSDYANYGSMSVNLTIQGGSFNFDPTAFVDTTKYVVAKNMDDDYWYVSEIPHTHSYSEEVTTPATCLTAGEKTFTCECGDTYTEPISALGHDYIQNEYVPATTYAAGHTAGRTCSRCDYCEYEVIPQLTATDDTKTEVAVEADADGVDAEIPAEAFEQKEEENTKPVVIKAGDYAEVTFDQTATEKIDENAGSESKISLIVQKFEAAVKQAAITAAGVTSAKKVISISMTAGSTEVYSAENAAGTATVSIPYTAASNMLAVYYINGSVKEAVPFTYANGKITFTVGHFSDYVICDHDEHNFVNHVCSECGELDEHVKFYLSVESGNKIDLIVDDTYKMVVNLPEDGKVNTGAVTVTCKMQNVGTLGVDGLKQHSITVNTGLGENEVDLQTWLESAYNFDGGEITANIDGTTCTYSFTKSGNTIVGTTDTTAARAAWQALTSHVTTATQSTDDSYIKIANGSSLKIGEEHLCFEDGFNGDLLLNNFSDMDAMNTLIRSAVQLISCEDQGNVITLRIKSGSQIAIGSTVATWNDDYEVTIEPSLDAVNNLLDGQLTEIKNANGKTDTIKKLISAFDNVIHAVDSSASVAVNSVVKIAKIVETDVEYNTFAAALAAATAGQTIQLLADVADATSTVVLTAIDLDLNGYSLEVGTLLAFGARVYDSDAENRAGVLKVLDDAHFILANSDNAVEGAGTFFPVKTATGTYKFACLTEFKTGIQRGYTLGVSSSSVTFVCKPVFATEADLDNLVNAVVYDSENTNTVLWTPYAVPVVVDYSSGNGNSTGGLKMTLEFSMGTMASYVKAAKTSSTTWMYFTLSGSYLTQMSFEASVVSSASKMNQVSVDGEKKTVSTGTPVQQ